MTCNYTEELLYALVYQTGCQYISDLRSSYKARSLLLLERNAAFYKKHYGDDAIREAESYLQT